MIRPVLQLLVEDRACLAGIAFVNASKHSACRPFCLHLLDLSLLPPFCPPSAKLLVPDCTGCLGDKRFPDKKASLRRSTPLFYVGCSLQLAGSQKQRTCLPISGGQSGPPTLATRVEREDQP